ncbi:MAG TPA: DUF4232 domain-containing protein [Candidatus Limnocylindria bacterium]|nr:DUF4232 domain-containing protein [Candidatus Limnocylindria bacterium]
MTDRSDDVLDPFEDPLRRRVRAFSDRAVLPIDAVAVARAAVTTRRWRWGGRSGERDRTGMRLGWILAAGLLVAAVGGIAVIGGGTKGLLPPPASIGTSAPRPTSTAACTPNDVDAVITAWDGAAGSRIATIELHNTAGFPCTMWKVSGPKLVDGHGAVLIEPVGGSSAATIEIAPGEVLHTMVGASNYCGPIPEAPVTVLFQQSEQVFVATALPPDDLDGVPPCMGDEEPASIQMQPWTR